MSESGRNAQLLEAALRYTPSGKSILITGGTKGIGRAVVEELGGLRCRVFTCCRRGEDLAELLEASREAGHDVQGIGGSNTAAFV
jgi:NAD(P)-dependent dehydrogenase (short-subunit alcohol dehydrogenase family)